MFEYIVHYQHWRDGVLQGGGNIALSFNNQPKSIELSDETEKRAFELHNVPAGGVIIIGVFKL